MFLFSSTFSGNFPDFSAVLRIRDLNFRKLEAQNRLETCAMIIAKKGVIAKGNRNLIIVYPKENFITSRYKDYAKHRNKKIFLGKYKELKILQRKDCNVKNSK